MRCASSFPCTSRLSLATERTVLASVARQTCSPKTTSQKRDEGLREAIAPREVNRPGTEGVTTRERYEGVGESRKRVVEEGSVCTSSAVAYPVIGVRRGGEVAVAALPQDRQERGEGVGDVEEEGSRGRKQGVELVGCLLLSMPSSGSMGSGRVCRRSIKIVGREREGSGMPRKKELEEGSEDGPR
uniref:Uncharacterized protein n=1 Tax=Oryza nivara TaxID=4536 RepID=A0A0E0IS16_ORYNI